MQLAYAHLNLRKNPFGEPPVDEAAALLVCDHIDTLTARLHHALRDPKARCIIQFMGECGRGKSSHMRALHAHFPGAPWLYFAAHEPPPRLPSLRTTPLLFLDETQRISWWTRQRLWRSRVTLVIATHKDHSQEWGARASPITHVPVGGLHRARLRVIAEARIAWATRDSHRPPGIELPDALLDALLERHGDDLRAILRTLYELVQHMHAPGHVRWSDDLDLTHIEPSGHLPRNHTRATFTRAPHTSP